MGEGLTQTKGQSLLPSTEGSVSSLTPTAKGKEWAVPPFALEHRGQNDPYASSNVILGIAIKQSGSNSFSSITKAEYPES